LSLRPGMYAMLRFSVTPAEVPGVPDDALVFRGGKVYAPLVHDGKLHLAEVRLGTDDGHTVEIVEGVKTGEVIALNVGQGVEDGDPVQPVEAESDEKSAPGSPG